MADEPGDRERGFTIVDRRASAKRGEADAPGEPAASGSPRVDFGAFVLSIATSAFYHLGIVAHPETGQKLSPPDLALASNTIDTLELLEVKTRGNLDEEERELLESLLYELRMHFVEAGKKPGP
jgi:hypothetical protein